MCWRALFPRQPADIEGALKAYVAERKPRTDWVTLKSREQFKQQPAGFAAAVRRSYLAVRQ